MNFQEACELSKKHPGSVVRRVGSGDFVVLDCDGARIDLPEKSDSDPCNSRSGRSQDAATQGLRAKLEAAQSALEHFRSSYERATQELNYQASQVRRLIARVSEERAKYDDLKEQYARLHKQHDDLNRSHKACSEEKSLLKTKIDSISEAEWKLINARYKKEKEDYAKEMREKRVTMRCPCSGEVENCVRCYGAGEYLVDGYGNPV